MNSKRLTQVIDDLKNDLGEGLVATDIWQKDVGQAIVGHNSQPKATALFNEVTRYLVKTLAGSGFPGLGHYYIINLEKNLLVVVLNSGDLQMGMLVDTTKATIGILITIAVPNALKGLEEASK
jgi:hypothetical protein